MHVVAHEPHAWFLLAHDGALYLDVNCSYSAVSFPMLIRLTEREAEQYRDSGRAFVSRLAEEVQDHALSVYRTRNEAQALGASVHEAVLRWRASGALPPE